MFIRAIWSVTRESTETFNLCHPRVKGGTRNLDQCRQLRCIQLYIQLLNIVQHDLIFTWKLLSLGISIVSGYAAISHFGDYPIFGFMYCVLFFDSAIIYTVLYAKALLVPGIFKKAKVAILHRLSRYRKMNKFENAIIQKQLISIPPVGIKVGEFHVLERTSVPVFLDYVIRNIVSMLVALQ